MQTWYNYNMATQKLNAFDERNELDVFENKVSIFCLKLVGFNLKSLDQ